MTRDELVLPAGFHTSDQFNAIKIRNYFETYRLLAFYLAAIGASELDGNFDLAILSFHFPNAGFCAHSGPTNPKTARKSIALRMLKILQLRCFQNVWKTLCLNASMPKIQQNENAHSWRKKWSFNGNPMALHVHL